MMPFCYTLFLGDGAPRTKIVIRSHFRADEAHSLFRRLKLSSRHHVPHNHVYLSASRNLSRHVSAMTDAEVVVQVEPRQLVDYKLRFGADAGKAVVCGTLGAGEQVEFAMQQQILESVSAETVKGIKGILLI